MDVRADSDYSRASAPRATAARTWRATLRANFASEDRGNGTPLQVNDTEWRQFAGDVNGSLAGGFWTARVTGGSQDYFQTFSAIAANRQTERLTNDQTVPGDFFTAGGQWMRAWKAADILVGRRRAADERRPQRHHVSGHRCAGLYLDAGSRGAERVSLRPHPLRLPPGPVARRRRPRRSLGVDAIARIFSARARR